MNTRLFLLLPILLVLPACGGGERHGDVVAGFAPEYQELRAELAKIAGLIPETVTPNPSAPALAPLPQFGDKKLSTSNTAIVMFDQLLDPGIDLRREGKLEFYYDNTLIRHLNWTGPDSPMSDKLKKKRAGESLARELQYPLDLRYIAVVRTLRHVPAKALSAEKFEGGAIAMGLYLVDRQQNKVVAQGGIVASTDAEVSYRHTAGSDAVSALENWANSSLWENARKLTLAKFAEISGGSFSG